MRVEAVDIVIGHVDKGSCALPAELWGHLSCPAETQITSSLRLPRSNRRWHRPSTMVPLPGRDIEFSTRQPAYPNSSNQPQCAVQSKPKRLQFQIAKQEASFSRFNSQIDLLRSDARDPARAHRAGDL